MNRNNEFIKNTIILAFGKISTQLISFLFIPIYTHYLLADDFGLVDLYQTLITMLIPFVNIRLDVVAFKFLAEVRDNVEEKNNVLNNIFKLLLLSISFSLIVGILLYFIFDIKYFWSILINLIISSISIVFLQILRGLKYNKEYSIGCFLTSLVSIIFTVLLIIVLNCGARSILITSSISNFVCIIYCLIVLKPSFLNFNKKFDSNSKEIIKYSFPMILDASSWWIVNASDRTIISFVLDVAKNGIYSISCKFSNILNSVFLIFNMSWQESVISHINDKDSGLFISKLGNEIIKIFLCISILMITFIPLVFNIIIGVEFVSSYKYIPILLYSNIFSIISTLIGSIMIVYGDTKKIAKTTFVSAIINIVVNLIFIKFIGLFAAAISTLFSYMVIFYLRYVECRKKIQFKLDFKMIFIYSILFICFSLSYLINDLVLNIISFLLSVSILFVFNKKIIFHYCNLILKKIK